MKRWYLFLVFILVIGIVFAVSDRGGRATLIEAEDTVIIDGEGKAVVSVRGDELKFRLQVRELPFLIDTGDLEVPGVKEYHFYEAWLVTEEDDMVSMGAFNVDKSGKARTEAVFDVTQLRNRQGDLVDIGDVEMVMVTAEKQDGDNMPGDIILEGEI